MKVEIIENNHEIDFNKVQLLQSKRDGEIVLCLYSHSDTAFKGISLNKGDDNYEFDLRKDWDKSKFKVFNGKIILENE